MTTKRKTERVERGTPDILRDKIQELKTLFPETISEGKVDFDKLKAALGDEADDRPERYSFSWAGKRDAIRTLQTPSRAALIPAPEESINFDSTQNLFIEGDNLEVLKLLYKSYFGRVKMIYIDPPYNTGNDFIYLDNYADPLDSYLKLTGQRDNDGNFLTSNPETAGRYHSAWLSMMYPRLFLARQLLKEDGVIFISIDDHEVHNLRLAMNEIFGEENFIATIIWQKVYSPKNTAMYFSEDHDYVLVYARNATMWRPDLLPRTDEANARYENIDNDPRGPWKPSDLTARNYYSKGQYEVTSPSGKKFKSGIGLYWRQSHDKFLKLQADKRIWWGPKGDAMPALKRFLSEVQQGIIPQTLWQYKDVGHTQEAKRELLALVKFDETENVLNTVKPTRLIKRILNIATSPDNGDIVLDFFAGSSPTADAVLQQNQEDNGDRRFICVQFPETLPKPSAGMKTISDISKHRIKNRIAIIQKENRQTLPLNKVNSIGTRIFQLAGSSFKTWKGIPEKSAINYSKEMELFTNPLIEKWKPEYLLWEVILKEGLSLSSKIETVKGVKNLKVFQVTDPDKGQELLISLDEKVLVSDVRSLNLTKDKTFICRDSALDDETAANLALQCRLKTI